MAIVEIESVRRARTGPQIVFNLERPRKSATADAYAITISGWAVGKAASVGTVEITHDGVVLRDVHLHSRPDVTESVLKKLIGWTGVSLTGFRTAFSVIGLPRSFEIDVRVVLGDGQRSTLATISGKRALIPTDFVPTLQPLLLFGMGRSGTTWAMRLLSRHPEIVTYDAYPYETRVAQYWMKALRVLTEPAAQRSHSPDALTVGPPPFAVPDDEMLASTSGASTVSTLAGSCLRITDSFYNSLAGAQQRKGAKYFIEKFVPSDRTYSIFADLFLRTKPLYLVRDPRDVISSVLAFNARRGTVEFGRDQVQSDEDYVNYIARQTSTILRTWQETPNAKLVRYEDLVLQPMETLGSILGWLDVDSTAGTIEAMLGEALEDDGLLERHRTSVSQAASIGRWQQDLTPAVQARCRSSLGDVLGMLGYAS